MLPALRNRVGLNTFNPAPLHARITQALLSSLLPAAGPRPRPDPTPSRPLDTLATMLIVLLTIGILFVAREILVPIAIAVLLSFVLSPLVKLLRRTGLHKSVAVGFTVFATFLITVSLGGILAKQVSDLAADAPKYQATVTQKVDRAREFAANSTILQKLNAVIADFTEIGRPDLGRREVGRHDALSLARGRAPSAARSQQVVPADPNDAAPATPEPAAPIKVEVVRPAPGALTILQAAAGTAAVPLATTAFVALFIVFILMQREDLRNRFIRLVGFGDLQRTTLAMNDAANRLSRYFLAQVLLNTGFGLVVAAALTVIGVPNAILWGIVAIFMRFVPYIGAVGAALFPIVMAAAASADWSMVVETALLFAVAELVTGQVVEPLVYGQRTGISPIAVVLAATFWTWLWGPIGLVLSTPLTVCLVVMGRHVEHLAFLDIILGDAPALSAVEIFYQRMLAGDASEIVDHADRFLRERSLLDYCESVAMPALLLAQDDVERGVLEETRQIRIRDTMRDLVEDLADHDEGLVDTLATGPSVSSRQGVGAKQGLGAKPAPTSLDRSADGEGAALDAEARLPRVAVDAAWQRDKAVVCLAGGTPLDEAAAHLLADLLAERGLATHVEPAVSIAQGRLAHLREAQPRLVILSFLDADTRIARARLAVRRLRRHLPGVPIVAAFWMGDGDRARVKDLGAEVRSDGCVASLPDAIRSCLERAATAAPDDGPGAARDVGDGLNAASRPVAGMNGPDGEAALRG